MMDLNSDQVAGEILAWLAAVSQAEAVAVSG
jgi:hypothetical protein